ncbi:MAG: CHAD domain-containing protein [Planctomycetes bacterium]|nr:CHAD domain-containing protein [Planctomycetota bacterium]
MSKPITSEEVPAVCEALGLDAARGLRAAAVAQRLFAQTSHLHGLTKTARPLVELVAALRAADSGEAPGRDWRAALKQALPHPAGSQLEIILEAVAPEAAAQPESDAADRSIVQAIARRVAALAELAEGLTAGGTREATVAAALDDGQAVELLVSGDGAIRDTVNAARDRLAAWNATMLRPIRAVVVYEGEHPPTNALPPEPTAADVARHVFQTQWEAFLSRVYGVRYGDDIEYVHELRVALRRLLAALRAFRKALDGLVPPLRAELELLADALGKVRDSDVFLVFFREYAAQAPPEHWPYLRGLLRAERCRRRRGFRALLEGLESERFAAFRAKYDPILAGRAAEGGLAPLATGGDAPLRRRAPNILLKRLKVVRKTGRNLAAASVERQHALRIQCKRLRYTAEFLADLYPKGLAALIDPMQAMQDALGEVHDADVYKERITRYHARRRAAGDQALASQALGAVLAFLDNRRRTALDRALVAWKAFLKSKGPRKAAKAIP